MHTRVEKRLLDLEVWGAESPLNRVELGDRSLGIITSGISYQYVKEVHPEASVLKLGMTNPLPWKLIEDFISRVDKVMFVEEGDPYLEERIRSRFLVDGKGSDVIPIEGELNPEK